MSLRRWIARRARVALVAGLALGAAELALGAATPHGVLFTAARADDGGGGGGASGGGASGGGASSGGRGGGGGVMMRPRYGQPTIFDVVRGERRRRARPSRAARRVVRPQARPPAAVELIASNVAEGELAPIRDAGFTILGERRLALLPAATLRLRAPGGLSDRGARARIGRIAPAATVERNTLYRLSVDARPCAEGTCFPYSAVDWTVRSCAARGPIGLVDTGVDADHPALAGVTVETEATRSPGRTASSPEHGTEIGILLVGGQGTGEATGAAVASDARPALVAVDAFHKAGGSDAADAFDLVAALDLLSTRGVPIVNLSLAGPANAVLDAAGRRAAEKGMTVIAAAGNDGPKAGPRYPAAYPWAVAVTAVDARRRVYARAGRGAHVAFAAPGVRLQLPDRTLAPGPLRSGTSYAAALVTAALAARSDEGGDRLKALAAGAVDLGAPGRDPVFGWGAVGLDAACPRAPVAGREALAE